MLKDPRYRLCVITPDGRDITNSKSSRVTFYDAIKILGVAQVSELDPTIVSLNIDNLCQHARDKPRTRIEEWEGYYIDVDVNKSTTTHRAELLQKWASALNVKLEITVKRI